MKRRLPDTTLKRFIRIMNLEQLPVDDIRPFQGFLEVEHNEYGNFYKVTFTLEYDAFEQGDYFGENFYASQEEPE